MSDIGITSRLPADVYHALPGVSISRLKELQRSPLHYRYRLDHPKETPPMTLGTAAHCAVLEPERFVREFAVWNRRSDSGNACPRKGQFWDAFVLENTGKTILTEDEYHAAVSLGKAVRADALAMRYLETGEPEVSMQWTLNCVPTSGPVATVPCRGRADWLTRINGEHYVIGLKTARDPRAFPFGAAGYKLGYHMQWAFYFDGYKALTGIEPKMREIVVESSPPYDVGVYNIPDDVIEQGRADYETLLRVLIECERLDQWPGFAQGAEVIFTLPTYAYEKMEDIGDLGLEA